MTLNQLDEYFSAIGVTVVLVGQARHLDQARNLAAELRMPFELISESHDSVQSLAKVLGLKSDNDNPSFLLTDLQGYPFYWQDAGELTLLEQLKRVLFAVRLLWSQILRHQEKMT